MRAARPPPAVGKARAVVHEREKKLRARGGTRKADRSGSGACGIAALAFGGTFTSAPSPFAHSASCVAITVVAARPVGEDAAAVVGTGYIYIHVYIYICICIYIFRGKVSNIDADATGRRIYLVHLFILQHMDCNESGRLKLHCNYKKYITCKVTFALQ